MKKISRNQIKEFILLFFVSLFKTIRMQLGPKGVCIYPVTCTVYAKDKLKSKPFYIAIPLIILRVLSCNPITTIIMRIYYNLMLRKPRSAYVKTSTDNHSEQRRYFT